MKHDPFNGYTNVETWMTATLVANNAGLLEASPRAVNGEELRDALRPALVTSRAVDETITNYRADVSPQEYEQEVNWEEVLDTLNEYL